MKLAVDCDGVMFPFVDSYRRYLVAKEGRRAIDLPEPTHWNFFEDWGYTGSEFWGHLKAGAAGGTLFVDSPPYQGCAQALRLLRVSGHEVIIATDRGRFGPELVGGTAHWLGTAGIEFDGIYFGQDKTALDVDLFIEDSPDNLAALNANGVSTVRANQPYNLDAVCDYEMNKWGEIFGIVKHERQRADMATHMRVGDVA